MTHYAEMCGWTLARAHARSGEPAKIAGYLGKSDQFDEAIADFAAAYADQAERDHKVLTKAVRDGRLKVETLEED
jgi:NAD(P)H-dependent flavin oxidoreductase YrpB (nitropropane dioxygenase family)